MSENNVVASVRNDLTKMTPEFAKALPPHIPAERFVRVAMTAIITTPALLNADRQSLFSACTKAAQDGLLPDGKEAALVPYGGKIQYLPMIAGVLKKVRNSGELASITSQIIYEKDEFKYWIDGDGEHLEHRPLLFGERGKRIGAYALAKTKDNAVYIEVMTTAQINAVRNCSKAKNGPWDGPFEDEMIRKTVIRRLSKRLPMSTDLEQVIQRDDELYDLNKAREIDTSKGAQLAQMIGVATPEAERTETEVKAETNNDLPPEDQETPPTPGWDAGGTKL